MANILLDSFWVEIWPVAISRPLARIFHIFEIRFSVNSVDYWRYIIIWRNWYFDYIKAHTIVHSYFAYYLHRPTICHLQKVLLVSSLQIFSTCDGIILYGLFIFICIHMKIKLIYFDISISSITIDVQCIFSGDIFVNITCQYENGIICSATGCCCGWSGGWCS